MSRNENWRDDARCRNVFDAYVFFPGEKSNDQRAKSYCINCSVYSECREWGLNNLDSEGVIGGMTQSERRRENRRLRKLRLGLRSNDGADVQRSG